MRGGPDGSAKRRGTGDRSGRGGAAAGNRAPGRPKKRDACHALSRPPSSEAKTPDPPRQSATGQVGSRGLAAARRFSERCVLTAGYCGDLSASQERRGGGGAGVGKEGELVFPPPGGKILGRRRLRPGALHAQHRARFCRSAPWRPGVDLAQQGLSPARIAVGRVVHAEISQRRRILGRQRQRLWCAASSSSQSVLQRHRQQGPAASRAAPASALGRIDGVEAWPAGRGPGALQQRLRLVGWIPSTCSVALAASSLPGRPRRCPDTPPASAPRADRRRTRGPERRAAQGSRRSASARCCGVAFAGAADRLDAVAAVAARTGCRGRLRRARRTRPAA
jgi:hypothetical protein